MKRSFEEVKASNTEARTFLMGGDELSGAPGTKEVSLQALVEAKWHSSLSS